MNTVTKEFIFDASHMLPQHDGLCKNVHGHTYKVQVTIWGPLCQDANDAQYGMIIDFKKFKEMLNKHIFDTFDHAFVYNENTQYITEQTVAQTFRELGLRCAAMPVATTAENMAQYFYGRIESLLPAHVYLNRVDVYETPTSYATYKGD